MNNSKLLKIYLHFEKKTNHKLLFTNDLIQKVNKTLLQLYFEYIWGKMLKKEYKY